MVVGFLIGKECKVTSMAWREFLWQHKNLDLAVAQVCKWIMQQGGSFTKYALMGNSGSEDSSGHLGGGDHFSPTPTTFTWR
jgi:hypothetical protein